LLRFYTNENFPQPVVEELRRLGHDVITVLESGHAGSAMPDKAVLEYATHHNRILVTMNRRHFIRLHGIQPSHKGIVVCTFDPNFTELAGRIHNTLMKASNVDGKLLRVNQPG
jgi:hypothetical protein